MDGAGISALSPTVGLSGLPAPLGEATAALEARRRQQVQGARAPAWLRDIGANIGNLVDQPLSAFIPPELRDRLPSPEMVANIALGVAPGSGDYMAARDAIGYGVSGLSALGRGDYMGAGARGIDTFRAAIGMAPFIPYFAGMARKPSTYDIGSRIRKHAADMGWEVTDAARSASSGSNYLHLSRPSGKFDEFGDPIMDHVKLRISDHDLPPSYKRTIGEADYDVGVGGKTRMDEQGGWADAVGWLARRAGVEPPKAVQRYMAPVVSAPAVTAMSPEMLRSALSANPAAMELARRSMAPGVPREQMLDGARELSRMLGGEVTVYGLSNAMIGLR